MKAAVFNEYGANSVVETREMPIPSCGPDDVLIKVRAASVNPVDWKVRSGQARIFTGRGFPKVLGNECAGEVAAAGSRVRRFKAGDRVIGRPGIRRLGAFAEFCCAPEAAVFPMAPGLSFGQAACLPIAGVTALQALRDKGQVSYSKKVLVNGAAGGVGHFAVQIAKIFGADVTGVCSTGNIDLVRALGADRVIDHGREDFTQGDARYDIIFDAVAKRSFGEARRVLAGRGIYISTLPSAGVIVNQYLTRFFTDSRAWCILARPSSVDLEWLAGQVVTGRVRVVIDRKYRLDQVKDALAYSEAGKAKGKIVLEIAP